MSVKTISFKMKRGLLKSSLSTSSNKLSFSFSRSFSLTNSHIYFPFYKVINLSSFISLWFIYCNNKWKCQNESKSFLDDLSISTNNGDIELSNVNCEKTIVLDSKNDSISGSIKGSYDDYKINCSIKKGNSSLPTLKEDGEKILRVNANNGDINLSFVSKTK